MKDGSSTHRFCFLLVAVFCVVHAQNKTEHERDKRFSPIVSFYENLNYGVDGGLQLHINDNALLTRNDLAVDNMKDKISSIRFYGYEWHTRVCKGTSLTGTCWGFRGSADILDLRDFDLNNNIESMESTYIGPSTAGGSTCGIVVYQHDTYRGKSVYIGPGMHNDITTAAYGGYGTFPNDAMSSVYLLPYTQAIFFKDKNPDPAGGQRFTYVCYPGNPYMQDCMVPNLGDKNDWVSAVKVLCV